MIEKIRQFPLSVIDRLKYPSHTRYSTYISLNIGSYESAAGTALFTAAPVLKAKGVVDEEEKTTIADISKKMLYTGAPLLVSATSSGVLSELVAEDSELFGNILTVSKVAVFPGYFGNMFSEVKDEKYVGELHLTGKVGRKNPFIGKSPSKIYRDGLWGLYYLANACYLDQKCVNGLNYFVGCSNIITPRLERFGFEVKNVLKGISQKLTSVDLVGGLDRATSGIPYSSRTTAMACIISRESLLANRSKIAYQLTK